MLGCREIPSFDIRAQCSGALYGFEIARKFLIADRACRAVMIICGEALSKRLDTSRDGRNLSVLLGDGAAACILERSETAGRGLIDVLLGADGLNFDLLKTDAPGARGTTYLEYQDVIAGRHQFRMHGRRLAVDATKRIVEVCQHILERNKLTVDDIDLVIPHQANLRILEEVMQKLGIGRERFSITVDRLGNMASASFPVTLSIARYEQRLPPGTLSLFVTYGAGTTWGAALYRS